MNASRVIAPLGALLFAAAPALAQEPASQPVVTLQVRAPETVDAAALAEALASDLGVRVELVRPDAEGEARVIVDVTPEGTVVLRVRRDGLPPTERETEPGPDRRQTTVTISLLASNLVRDESEEVLGLLEPPPEPPIVVVSPEDAPPPPAQPEAEPPATEAPPPPPPPEPPPVEEEPFPFMPFAVDFVPFVGFSSAGPQRRVLSLGVVGALSGSVDGFSGSSVLDLTLRDVRGAQLAGVLSVARRVNGVQGSGVVSIAHGGLRGVQMGTLNIASSTRGAQLGIVDIGGDVGGVQAGVLTVAGPVRGAQLGVLNVAAGPVYGAQLGVLNVAAETHGAQLGIANVVGGRANGVQIGLFNYAEEADVQIGLVSIQARGRTNLRAEIDTTGLVGVSLVHGGVTHTILSARVYPFSERPVFALGLGFGVRAQLADIVHLDIETTTHALIDEDVTQHGAGLLAELRAQVGVDFVDGVAGYLGVGYRVQVVHSPDAPLDDPLLSHFYGGASAADYPDFTARGWPFLVAGVELF